MSEREEPARASKPVERGEVSSSRSVVSSSRGAVSSSRGVEARSGDAPKPRPVLRIAKLGQDFDESDGH